MKRKLNGIFSFILVLVMSMTMLIPAYAANTTEAETQAVALKQLGLFKGVSDTEFDLGRAPTRTEALVMLIRILGRESEAINGNWSHPFTDVASWADKYVGYAYENGLTKGISATEFGTGNADSDMYLTFMLRALNYDDSKGDFTWSEPDTLATTAGILPSGVDTANFLRADVVLVSWASLEAKLKDGSKTLTEKLVEEGVFTADKYGEVKQTTVKITPVQPATTYELKDGVAMVKSMAELKGALAAENVSEIEFSEAFHINEDITITKALTIIEMDVSSSATLTVKSNVTLGGAVFENTGSVIVCDAGFFGVYQTEFKNQGQFTVEKDGNLELDRGGEFKNFGTLANSGTITITSNGGNMYNDEKGSIENNGVIDCTGYYKNAGTYTGTATEPIGID